MTIGDYPDFLSIGYLFNQGMLKACGNQEDWIPSRLENDSYKNQNKTNYEKIKKEN